MLDRFVDSKHRQYKNQGNYTVKNRPKLSAAMAFSLVRPTPASITPLNFLNRANDSHSPVYSGEHETRKSINLLSLITDCASTRRDSRDTCGKEKGYSDQCVSLVEMDVCNG